MTPGDQQAISITTPLGGNCFDPDCTIRVTVDHADDVDEANESNNEREAMNAG
jgi:hypothetical protein